MPQDRLESRRAAGGTEPRLGELIQYHYGLTVRHISAGRQGWRLHTDQGHFTLTRLAARHEAYWEMVARLLHHLRNSGLTQLPRLYRTKRGQLAFHGHDARYALWHRSAADPCDWRDPAAWYSAGQTLAQLHAASRDFPLAASDRRFQAYGRWQTLWERQLARLAAVRAACQLTVRPHEADRLWLTVGTYAPVLVETALAYLEKSGGDRAVQALTHRGIVGQLALRRNSWGFDRAARLCTINDWTQTVLDIPVRDLAHMIHLAAGDKAAFTARVGQLLDGYQSVQPLAEEAWPLLYARLLFPEPLVRAANTIYAFTSERSPEAAYSPGSHSGCGKHSQRPGPPAAERTPASPGHQENRGAQGLPSPSVSPDLLESPAVSNAQRPPDSPPPASPETPVPPHADDAPHLLARAINDQHRRERRLRHFPRLLQERFSVSIPTVDWLS